MFAAHRCERVRIYVNFSKFIGMTTGKGERLVPACVEATIRYRVPEISLVASNSYSPLSDLFCHRQIYTFDALYAIQHKHEITQAIGA